MALEISSSASCKRLHLGIWHRLWRNPCTCFAEMTTTGTLLGVSTMKKWHPHKWKSKMPSWIALYIEKFIWYLLLVYIIPLDMSVFLSATLWLETSTSWFSEANCSIGQWLNSKQFECFISLWEYGAWSCLTVPICWWHDHYQVTDNDHCSIHRLKQFLHT